MNFWNNVILNWIVKKQYYESRKEAFTKRILVKVTSAFLPFFISRNHLRIRCNHSRRPCLEQPTFAISVKEIISRIY